MATRPVVIGAGPAGLAAALRLAEAGAPPLVLEAEEGVGGLAASFDLQGFRVDYGPHRLHRAASPEVLDLYRSLLGDALLEQERRGLLHLGERKLPYPLSLLGIVRGLGPKGVLTHGGSALWSRLHPPRGEDYGGEAARRLGRHAAKALYEPAARKVWGLEPEALDRDLGRARVQKKGVGDVLRSMGGRSPGRRFFYPEKGCGALMDALASRVRGAGGEIRTGAEVLGLVLREGRVRGVALEGGDAIPADRVIATAALPSLCRWAGIPEAAEGLQFRALVLFFLVLEADRLSDRDVHYFADERLPANRLFEMKGFDGKAGRGGRTAVGFDLPCAVGDEIWRASPDELLERIRPVLRRVGAEDVPVLDKAVRRIPAAYPLYRKGFRPLRDGALDALAEVEGLYPLGRSGLFVHDNIHHAMAAGLDAGRWVAEGGAARGWREALRPHLFAQVED